MTAALSPTMADALRLTRTGNLAEATRLLLSALGGGTEGPIPFRSPVTGPIHDLKPARVRTAPQPQPAPVVTQASPGDGRFLDRRYSGGADHLDYKLYIPPDAAPGMPLIVMLHGCTQSPDDFARGTGMNRLADEMGFLVAYPAQSHSANPQKCWNWFKR